MDGVVVVDKPQGWTSHDVVAKMRRIAKTKRIGHLGTLDPMATGVLPLVLNKATRLAQFFMRMDKVYEATLRFGHSTNTYDAEGESTSENVEIELDAAKLDELFNQFRGKFEQMPPPVSAKKINGVPAYKLARKNKPVDLKPVEVTVHALELLGVEGSAARIRVHCSGGTYVRSIAHDVGQTLGSGAYLESLRRTISGVFTLSEARTLQQLEELSNAGNLEQALVPATHLLPEFPIEQVDALTIGHIRQGRDFRVSPFRVARGTKYVKAVSLEGELVAIGEAILPHVYHPMLVF